MFAKRAHASHDFELNLTPIIDCFVTLICFMLLSATYVNLVGVEAKVPITVVSSAAPVTDNKPKFKLELNVKNSSMELVSTAAGKFSGKKTFANVGGKPDLVALHTHLIMIKKEFPKEFSIHFNGETEMLYEDLVHLMDATRNIDKKDGEFVVTDERNGKPTKIDLLFPDFVMGNLGAK